MKKLIIAIITMLSLIPTAAFAASQPATLTDDMNIYYNGYSQCFTDGKGTLIRPEGNTVFPIVLEGTTYLPVRFVAELTGLSVNWDQNTRTVELTRGDKIVTDYRGGYGFESSKQITVDTSQNIKITLDGKVQNVPEPFIYNGTTYLPVRAICDMVGIPVEWRSDTKTILLGTYLHEASPSAIIPADAKVLTDKDMIEPTGLTGVSYKNGMFFIKTDSGVIRTQGFDFNNEGYKTLTFTVTTDDVCNKDSQNIDVVELDSNHNGIIGSSIATIPQAYGKTKTYSVDVSGYNKLSVQVGTGSSSNAIVGDVYLTK